MYIFPTVLRPIFKLFLKSRNLNELIISPKIHSTDVLTVLMDLLYAIMSGVSTAPSRGMLGPYTGTVVLQLGRKHIALVGQVDLSLPAFLHHVVFLL